MHWKAETISSYFADILTFLKRKQNLNSSKLGQNIEIQTFE